MSVGHLGVGSQTAGAATVSNIHNFSHNLIAMSAIVATIFARGRQACMFLGVITVFFCCSNINLTCRASCTGRACICGRLSCCWRSRWARGPCYPGCSLVALFSHGSHSSHRALRTFRSFQTCRKRMKYLSGSDS